MRHQECDQTDNALSNPATRHFANDRSKKTPASLPGFSNLVELRGIEPLTSTMPL
jgi:hypothetical protein